MDNRGLSQSEFTQQWSRAFTFFITISLLLASFKNIIPGLDLGDIVLVIAICSLFFRYRVLDVNFHCPIGFLLLVLFFAFLVITLFDGYILEHYSYYDVMIREIRWFFYIIVVIIGTPFWDYQYGVRLIKAISVLSCLLLLVQRLYIRIAGKALSVTILGKEIGNSVEYLRVNGTLTTINRPSSFFSEPAHFTFFAVLGLIFVLSGLTKDTAKKSVWIGIFISVSLILSTSTYAYFLLILIWGWFLLCRTRISIQNTIIFLSILLALLVVIPMLDWENNRDILYFLKKLSSFGTTSRTTYFAKFDDMLTGLQQWLGLGVGNEEFYLFSKYGFTLGYVNSVTMTYLYCGIVGLAIWGVFWIAFFAVIGKKQWLLGWTVVILALCSTDFYGKFAVLYFLIIGAQLQYNNRNPLEMRSSK